MNEWRAFCKFLTSHFDTSIAKTWLRGLKIISFDKKTIFIKAEDSLQKHWIEEHVVPLAKIKLLTPSKHPYALKILLEHEIPKKTLTPSAPTPKHSLFKKLEPNESQNFDSFVPAPDSLLTFRALNEVIRTLKNHSADKRIQFNLIYIFGPKGSGKTHLLNATVSEMIKAGLSPLFLNISLFTDQFVNALRSQEMIAFRKYYRSFDALIVDDIENLSEKKATQEEFFHTFNHYHSSEKPIVLASNIIQSSLQEIEPRLVSRFQWGLTVSVKPLALSYFPHAIDIKTQQLNMILPSDCKEYLTSNLSSLSMIFKVLEMCKFQISLKYSQTTEITTEMLKPLVEKTKSTLKVVFTDENILECVSKLFAVEKTKLLSRDKTKGVVYPRKLSMYLMRSFGKKTFKHIGKFFNKDHSTVICSIKDIEKLLSDKAHKAKEQKEKLITLIKEKAQ